MTYVDILRKYLLNQNPDALLWIQAYGLFVHAVDDIIDNDAPKDKTRQQLILQTFEFAESVYSNHFYIKHIGTLRPLIKMTSNAYMDSVLWEGADEPWKRQVSDALRQIGNEVLLAVIEICGGFNARRQASLEIRQVSWHAHHLKDGTPV